VRTLMGVRPEATVMAVELVTDDTDELWAAVEPHLPPRPGYSPKGGRPRLPDDRAALRGILYVLRQGCHWQKLPSGDLGCPSGSTCWRRFRDWTATGVWGKAHHALLAALGEEGLLNLGRAVVDSASVRAKKGGRTPARTRPTAAKGGASGT
jgi:transposase